ncbi:mannose-6-phosphate isomerase [Tilletiaria anomala UBC 951]|uniref:Mannose-6-phosphate isomerase n=1 Tax=Tilletiaria anomala (strain ATCC 24038 / CBS 436.72 / UBC 951) TaxID=1037660 RepID=A0A066W3E2_TILAU|nr:mannose-6-phosphate isomerase [Tilletiaria anomala UBC 951]KDN45609.1 mannose-6-phosphate isomerase [Tilletiaria anomala UBC 951]
MTSAGSDAQSGPLGPVFRVVPGVQSYDWGIKGKDGSLVAKFAFEGVGANLLGHAYDDDKPYAELWMGTHPCCPSRILPRESSSPTSSELVSLSSYLASHPDLLSKAVIEHYGIRLDKEHASKNSVLPFLFKVLSVGKALSIQAHPDRNLAKQLHRHKPNLYKDDNHKPEMAIAITDFCGFCGFRPFEEVARFVTEVPEFKAIVNLSEETINKVITAQPADVPEDEQKNLLSKIFSGLMKAPDCDIQKYTTQLVQRYSSSTSAVYSCEAEASIPRLVLSLHAQFPNDIGLFCAFLLNEIHLTPGQALFLGANTLHAYLHGEIIECMAASDNVVRAGLTPKARDVNTLVDMLTFENGPGDRQLMQSHIWDGGKFGLSTLYQPPIDEFNVLRTVLGGCHGKEESHRSIRGPSITIVTQGKVKTTWDIEGANSGSMDLVEGNVIFIAASTTVNFLVYGEQEAILFRAYVEV